MENLEIVKDDQLSHKDDKHKNEEKGKRFKFKLPKITTTLFHSRNSSSAIDGTKVSGLRQSRSFSGLSSLNPTREGTPKFIQESSRLTTRKYSNDIKKQTSLNLHQFEQRSGLPTQFQRRSSGSLKRNACDVKSEVFLKEPEFVRELRRNSYGGRPTFQDDTNDDDDFLTTTLCSTEL